MSNRLRPLTAVVQVPFRGFGLIGWLFIITSVIALGQQTSNPEQASQPKQTSPSPSEQTSQPASQQTAPAPPAPTPESSEGAYGKHHIFWVIPNYRSDESSAKIEPLTPREKFKLAFDDSFDPTAFLVAGVFAGSSMAQHQYHFEQGATGFAKYYGGAFADQAIGNMMTEALFPVALHQDPRYFTKSRGGFWSRTGYALSREIITRGDDGRSHFNTSELAGNAVAAGISNLYYPAADRSFGSTADKWAQQIGLDSAFNIMKEFWPDVRRKFFGK